MARRSTSGFTVIERFVLVVIIALLVGVALPYFFNAQDTQTETTIKANMKIAQMAAESYARDNGGMYPSSANDLGYKSYFPGGNRNVKSPSGGSYTVNPFTNVVEPPLPGSVSEVEKFRHSAPARLGEAGAIYYNPIAVKGGDEDEKPAYKSYAIQGAGKTGYAVLDSEAGTGSKRRTLILSTGP